LRCLVLCWTDGIRHLGYADPSVCRRRSSYRARSGLQIVSGILYLQSAHVQSAEANEALQKASARVLAIAAVHGRLYTGKSIRSVPLGALSRRASSRVAGHLASCGPYSVDPFWFPREDAIADHKSDHGGTKNCKL